MRQTIVGNWKMQSSAEAGVTLARAIAKRYGESTDCEVVLCPPAILLPLLSPFGVPLGGQDCHTMLQGAFTGDISAVMLKEAGAQYVIVGHSERRIGHRETDTIVKAKAETALQTGLVPIICVGEADVIRDRGGAPAYVAAQLAGSLPQGAAPGSLLVAYEPIWAIGTGKVATVKDIEAMHRHIKDIAAKKLGTQASKIRVLYGGSVKPDNAREILLCPAVDGVLVGGASLDAVSFCSIIDAARK